MDIGLVLGLVKVALEVFKDERRGRFASQRDKIEKEWQDEMSKPDDDRSDLELDRLLFESRQLAKVIIAQAHSQQ
jgi:hypothetical protein